MPARLHIHNIGSAFHIARSLNRNLVCYDANQTNAKLDSQEPIKVYWLNREKEPGKTKRAELHSKKDGLWL